MQIQMPAPLDLDLFETPLPLLRDIWLSYTTTVGENEGDRLRIHHLYNGAGALVLADEEEGRATHVMPMAKAFLVEAPGLVFHQSSTAERFAALVTMKGFGLAFIPNDGLYFGFK